VLTIASLSHASGTTGTLAVRHVLAASTGTTSSGGGGSSAVSLLVLVAIVVLAYLLFIRPRMRRQRTAMTQRGTCEVGDEVTTTAGLIATVVAVDDDAVTLEVAPGVHSRYLPAAIMKVNHPDVPLEPEDGPIEHESLHDQQALHDHESLPDYGAPSDPDALPDYEARPGPSPDDESDDKPTST
jgi:preprotein translocase subunit YajC